MQLGRTGNRHHPGFLPKNPCQRDLGRCSVLVLGELTDQVHYSLVCVAILWREAGDNIAEVVLVELRVFVNRSREETFSERAERHETDAEFLESRDDFLLRFSPPKRVFALQRGYRLHFVGTANRLSTRFRKSEVLHLAFLNEVLDGSCNIFNRNLVIDAVLIEQIDDIGFQALERCLGGFLDVSGPAVQAGLLPVLDFEAEFCGDLHKVAEWSECFADEFFICVGAINFCCIEERDAKVHCSANERKALLLIYGRAVAEAQAHAAESNRRSFQIAFAEVAFLHRISFWVAHGTLFYCWTLTFGEEISVAS